MLVSEIETQRQAQGTARPPILPATRRSFEQRKGWPIMNKPFALPNETSTPKPSVIALKPSVILSAAQNPCISSLFLLVLLILSTGPALATTAVTNTASAESPSQGTDPILNAMQQELDREKGLLLPGMRKPYFIEYRLDDITTYEAVANYGALTREEPQPPARGPRHCPHRRLRHGQQQQPRRRHRRARPHRRRSISAPVLPVDRDRLSLQKRASVPTPRKKPH